MSIGNLREFISSLIDDITAVATSVVVRLGAEVSSSISKKSEVVSKVVW
jgi:hypothetical protein